MFVCKKCDLSKAVDDFRFHKRGYRIGACRECENAYAREWTMRDPEKYRRCKRESMAQQRAKDPETSRQKQRVWRTANRERINERFRERWYERFFANRAKRLNNTGLAFDLWKLWKRQRGRCALTGRRLTRENVELDHIVPKVKGGTHDISNLRWTLKEANRAKRDLSDAEFLALCSDCVRWIGRRVEMVESLVTERLS
jgi:5-methylcytosine-specific restriction endonuclease McrA